MSPAFIIISAMSALVLLAPAASASTIGPPFQFSYINTASGNVAADTASVTGTTVSISSNFNSAPSGAYLQMIFNWTAGVTPADPLGLSPIDYRVTETITNNTVSSWNSFTIAWGCGTSALLTTCTPYPLSNDGTAPVSSAGGTVYSTPTLATWTGLTIAPGTTVTFTFGVNTTANAGVRGGWGIDATPNLFAAPEPGTIALSVVGLGLLCGSTRLRRGKC